MKKAISDNLEFLTDDLAVHQINQQEYQLGMVSLAGKTAGFNFPNVSNQSQLKKRIIMMKRTKSIKQQWMKILMIIPVLAILTMTLSGREVRMVYVEPLAEETLIQQGDTDFYPDVIWQNEIERSIIKEIGDKVTDEKSANGVVLDTTKKGKAKTEPKDTVVTATGQQRRISTVASVSNVNEKDLQQLSEFLAKRFVELGQATGEQGKNISDFWVRGIGTFGANSNALVLIDGVEGDINTLDIDDIESFSVLKQIDQFDDVR